MKFFSILLLASLLVYGGFVYFAPTQPIEDKKDNDTGFTRHETEELMRSIGYVQ